MEKDFKEILNTYLKKNSTIIVGVSGGPDSVYLLTHLLPFCQNKKIKIVVAHVNHGLRGKESDQEEKFVKNMAKKMELVFESSQLYLNKIFKSKKAKSGLKSPGNLEEIARQKRYDFFKKLREKYKADYILIAHHLNDNIETALFNLIRGASFQGIKGMQIYSKESHVLRPMLHLPKTEILTYLKEQNLEYHLDSSNLDLNFSRNLLRQKVIPFFKKINPGFEKTFQENLQNFTQVAEYIEEKSTFWLTQNYKNNHFPLSEFLELPSFLKKNVLVQIYKNTYGSTHKLTLTQINEIIKVLNLQKANRKKEFGSDFFIEVTKQNQNSMRQVKLHRKPLKKSQKRLK